MMSYIKYYYDLLLSQLAWYFRLDVSNSVVCLDLSKVILVEDEDCYCSKIVSISKMKLPNGKEVMVLSVENEAKYRLIEEGKTIWQIKLAN